MGAGVFVLACRSVYNLQMSRFGRSDRKMMARLSSSLRFS